jgi:hypothetical protein
MRKDALARFGTPLEWWFAAVQIGTLMEQGGLTECVFDGDALYRCVAGFQR